MRSSSARNATTKDRNILFKAFIPQKWHFGDEKVSEVQILKPQNMNLCHLGNIRIRRMNAQTAQEVSLRA